MKRAAHLGESNGADGGRTLEMLEHVTSRSNGSAWVVADDRTGLVFASLAAR